MLKKNSKEYIAYLTGILGATMIAKKMGSKSEKGSLPKQSVYSRGSGRSDTIGARDLLIEQLGYKYGEDATWEASYDEKIAVLTPFIPTLDPNKLYATMSSPMHSFRNMSVVSERAGSKPHFSSKHDPNIGNGGFWFAQGAEWIEWMAGEMIDWLHSQNYVYEVTLNDDYILKLSTKQDLINFGYRYQGNSEYDIRWQEVVDRYAGILISPYIYSARMDISWYYPWDVASGCVWNWEGIKEIKLIAQRQGTPAAPEIIEFGGEF